MARPKKPVSIDAEIEKQEEAVAKLREKYDENVRKLKDLYAKRDEEKEKALLDAVEKSKRSYEEIMSFLTSSEDE
jgi:Skp family chaperone for outer membrane proteins